MVRLNSRTVWGVSVGVATLATLFRAIANSQTNAELLAKLSSLREEAKAATNRHYRAREMVRALWWKDRTDVLDIAVRTVCAVVSAREAETCGGEATFRVHH